MPIVVVRLPKIKGQKVNTNIIFTGGFVIPVKANFIPKSLILQLAQYMWITIIFQYIDHYVYIGLHYQLSFLLHFELDIKVKDRRVKRLLAYS